MKKAEYGIVFPLLDFKLGSLSNSLFNLIYLNSLVLCFLTYKLGIMLPYPEFVVNCSDTMVNRLCWIL